MHSSDVQESSTGPALSASLQAVQVSIAAMQFPKLPYTMDWLDRLSAGIIPDLHLCGEHQSLDVNICSTNVMHGSPSSASAMPARFGALKLAARQIAIYALEAVTVHSDCRAYRPPNSDATMTPDPARELCRFWELCPASNREVRLCTGTRERALQINLECFRHVRRLTLRETVIFGSAPALAADLQRSVEACGYIVSVSIHSGVHGEQIVVLSR